MPPKFHGWMKVRIGNTNFHLFVFLRASNPFKDEQCLEHPKRFVWRKLRSTANSRNRWWARQMVSAPLPSYCHTHRMGGVYMLLHDWVSINNFLFHSQFFEGHQLSIVACNRYSGLALCNSWVFSMVFFSLFLFHWYSHIIVYSPLFCEHVNWNSSHLAMSRNDWIAYHIR